MAAHSHSRGHEIHKACGQWFYVDTGKPVDWTDPVPCAHCGRDAVHLTVPDVRHRNLTGEDRNFLAPIDACIADIVAALNAAGIPTETSCCGHGVEDGWITLADGRKLVPRHEEPPRDA